MKNYYLFIYLLILASLTHCKNSNTTSNGGSQLVQKDDSNSNETSNESLQLVWEDNFNGTTLNTNYWNFERGDGCPNLCGWGNNELQSYTDENHFLEDGFLNIEARYENQKFTSTRITTKDKKEFTYGKIEARIKLPKGNGVWPAFWLLGANINEVNWPQCGEIDILEYSGPRPNSYSVALHNPESYGNTKYVKVKNFPNIENDFHIYSIIWNKEKIVFFIDNQEIYQYNPSPKNNNNWTPYKLPFFIILNFAVGGTLGGTPDNSIFPQRFIIDYIKVYQ